MSDDTPAVATSPFQEYVPCRWRYQEQDHYVLKRSREFSGAYHLHNLNDELNDDKGDLEKCLIAYSVNGETHDLFTVKDYFNSMYSFDTIDRSNITGDLRERIARRNMKYFLRRFSKHGHVGDSFSGATSGDRDGFLIANNDTYVLKILHYPNMVLLKKDKEGKLGYQNLKELDGLFDYQYFMKRHLIVLESKSESFKLMPDDLERRLFEPLRQLFPDAQLHYVLFANGRKLFSHVKKDVPVLHKNIIPLHEALLEYGVVPFYFSFRESRSDMERMTDHLFLQHDLINRRGVAFTGKVVHTRNDLVVFDAGETPHLRLRRNEHSGLWKEVTRFRHKNTKRSNRKKGL
ncbi:hypothetical protein JXA12_01430 [Candidatus Woesearchaeota archaeon]|nr:hypothetical protein [Candidatus Woesearchaeota archaeon]